ncbi:sigma-24 (FecI-like) (plasmid) [Nitrobacter hamburgensis X14]|uniref:Sigma-24 (FecI-like) n=1 Tax=Nitrobacter hamburgensis (strain DSM 10229 / NCIMB 13809 / X14) TaxID=323097 RepID=Q1QEZ4_NITHX|nr:sigma-70 family RNA polymerase sigma factor [Nitrobacter hamburgensis]ABE65203.1 sigma-24 (FecI-like) [Nitrobacter hamburgensis X14]
MAPGRHKDNPTLRLVREGDTSRRAENASTKRDVEWSIYMARAQSGDQDAYSRLLTEITPYLRTLAGRHHRSPQDVEDTIQDILLTIHSIRQIYDPTRPFTPWLVAIGRRRIIDRLRRQGRSTVRETPLNEDHETIVEVEANIETRADGRSLREAVDKLPPGQREAITLLKLQEMSLKEAAERSGMSIAALKVATHRALKSLRTILGKDDNS